MRLKVNLVKGLRLTGLILSLGWLGKTSSLPSSHHLTSAITPASNTLQSFPLHSHPSILSSAEYGLLLRQAQAITVKIETPDNQGSGVIVYQKSGKYAVITNEHVILDSDRLIIQTADGRQHYARRHSKATFGRADLALIEFQSFHVHYPIATLTPGLTIDDGSRVFSAGFPYDLNHQGGISLQVTHGKISHIMDKGFNGGYQIGYSNWIPKGMSGGPVLNLKGQVIAINGLHADPLWGNPYVWDDGTIPPKSLFPNLADSSWAIPAETILQGIQAL